MRWLLPILLASLTTLALSLTTSAGAKHLHAGPGAAPALAAPRVDCHAPATLRLRRFEDGSAQLLCSGRVIVRVAAPG